MYANFLIILLIILIISIIASVSFIKCKVGVVVEVGRFREISKKCNLSGVSKAAMPSVLTRNNGLAYCMGGGTEQPYRVFGVRM